VEIFSIDKVSYTYKDGRKALDAVSLSVTEKESLTIIGTNGSGKSTLLYLLDGLLEPEAGKITAFGMPVGKGSPEFRQKVALLFQNPQVQLFSLSVWDELCFGPSQLGLERWEVEERASDILKLLGIEHLKERGPWNLSGGEMKKVAIGACLSTNPDVILLDEPTTGLDPRSQVEMIDLIIALRNKGKTIITATHDLGIIEDISDRTVVLGEDHRVMFEDAPWEVLKNTAGLLEANLIHTHAHRHSWYVHEHSHSGMHEHEHIPELTGSEEPGEAESSKGDVQTVSGEKSEIEKLKILIGHWIEHNHEHAGTYTQWAEKAKAAGNPDLAQMLLEIAAETKKMNALFEKAKRVLNNKP
jgi:cobalt/nickel transport system ATP-binding protein